MVTRILPKRENHSGPHDEQRWAEWLDSLENERDALIMRLRYIDKVLTKHNRLRSETLPRKER